ncbi:hypothetical protein MMC13_007279 [Lambiella insularis]|nr:hypothetical protein [Lambiella insularis]
METSHARPPFIKREQAVYRTSYSGEAKSPRLESLPLPTKSLVSAASGPDPLIDERALQGNMFIFLLAGHETTASTLQFAILCLASNPLYQRRLQSSLDVLLEGKHPSAWSLQHDFPRLFRGYPGAVVRETIRLFTVLPFYLRWTGNAPRPLVLQGKTYMVPSDTLVLVNISAAHRNPKYWPRPKIVEDPDGEEMPYALSEYDPGRWINPQTGEVDEAMAVKAAGAYIPFSRGSRECMGRRFAEIELIAMLSMLFLGRSVELNTVGQPGADERTRWENARKKAAKMLSRGIGFGVALKMMDEVPIRIVRRGTEKHGP